MVGVTVRCEKLDFKNLFEHLLLLLDNFLSNEKTECR